MDEHRKARPAAHPFPPVGFLRHRAGLPLLLWLGAYPLLEVPALAVILALDLSSVYTALRHLEAGGLIEHISPPLGGAEAHRLYYLSNLGMASLAALLEEDATLLARRLGSDEAGLRRLLPRVTQLKQITQFVSGLFAYAPGAVPQPSGDRSRVSWHWVRDYRCRFVSPASHTPLKVFADAALIWRTRPPDAPREQGSASDPLDLPTWHSAFVLTDAGVDDALTLMEHRLQTILAYCESLEGTPGGGVAPSLLLL